MGEFYRRLVKRKPRQVAIMALARKLVTIAWQMLKKNEPYRYAKPMLMAKKFSKLKRADEDIKKSSGPTARAKAKEELAAVYSELDMPGVPGPEELPEGERRMLIDKDVWEFVEQLYRPQTSTSASR